MIDAASWWSFCCNLFTFVLPRWWSLSKSVSTHSNYLKIFNLSHPIFKIISSWNFCCNVLTFVQMVKPGQTSANQFKQSCIPSLKDDLSNPPQPFYQSHVSFTPGLELFSSFLCSPIPCEESVTLWNCLIYIYLSYTSISFELTFNFVSTEHTGCISHWASPKTFKYGKPRLG